MSIYRRPNCIDCVKGFHHTHHTDLPTREFTKEQIAKIREGRWAREWDPIILAFALTEVGKARARIENKLETYDSLTYTVKEEIESWHDQRALLLRVEERICQRFS